MAEVGIRRQRLVPHQTLCWLFSTRDKPVRRSGSQQPSVLQSGDCRVLERAWVSVGVQIYYRVLVLLLSHKLVGVSEVVRNILQCLFLVLAVKLYRLDCRLGNVVCDDLNGDVGFSVCGVLLVVLVVVLLSLYVRARVRGLHLLGVPQRTESGRG